MITVIGSLNMDLIAGVKRLPQPGETLLATSFLRAPGAKGGNQAVAAARAGSVVNFVGRVGDDAFGVALIESLKAAGVGTEYVSVGEGESTGLALIAVDEDGENSIVVVPGANAGVTPAQVDAANAVMKAADLLVLQLEIPIDTVTYAARRGHEGSMRVLLNPSPAQSFDAAALQFVDVLVLNESELALVSGLGFPVDPAYGARLLLEAGSGAVVVTLGEDGCVVVTREREIEIPALLVEAVDTTGAGDAFLGNLAHALGAGEPLETAARFASAAAAWSIRLPGAQPSMPTRAQTETLLREFGP